MLSGGGTGGHISPLLAVAAELKKKHPRAKIIYIGERNSQFAHMVRGDKNIDEIYTIFAGKFRRYHGESALSGLFDIKTNLLNLRDVLYILIGVFQSLYLVKKVSPSVSFLKGGFVVVPVGFSLAFLKKPYVTHDSDALPGLANRLIAPWAKGHATALPEEFYRYPKDLTHYIGVLTEDSFKKISPTQQKIYKKELGIPVDSRMLLVTGGSLGAKRLNGPIADIVPKLLKDYSDLYVFHQTGKSSDGLYEDFVDPRLISLEFIKDMHRYTGAADIVVARAGANTLGELAVQGKAVVVVPNRQLTGGHQLKNASRLEELKAVINIPEKNSKRDAEELDQSIRDLLKNESKRHALGEKLHDAYPSRAVNRLTKMLTEVHEENLPSKRK